MTAEDYRQQAQEYRRRAALLAEHEQTNVDETSVPLQKGATTH
jgi:hypothetical protein